MSDITEFLERHACLIDGHRFVCTECGAEQPRSASCFFCKVPGQELVALRHESGEPSLYVEVCDACAAQLRQDPNRGGWFVDDCEHEWGTWQGPRQDESRVRTVWTASCRRCGARRVGEGNRSPVATAGS